MQWFPCPLAKQRLLPTLTLFFSFLHMKEHLYGFLCIFKALQYTSQHFMAEHSFPYALQLLLSKHWYFFCCSTNLLLCTVIPHHLIALYTVIRATRLFFLQYICSGHNHFCLVIFLIFTSPTSLALKLFIMNEKTEYSSPFPNMALDVLPACHTF